MHKIDNKKKGPHLVQQLYLSQTSKKLCLFVTILCGLLINSLCIIDIAYSNSAKVAQNSNFEAPGMRELLQKRYNATTGTVNSYNSEYLRKRLEERRKKYLESSRNENALDSSENSNYIAPLQPYRSQIPPRPPANAANKSNSEAQHVWNLRNADIRSIISEVSRQTGKKFIVDPRVQGKVTIVASTPISNKELYQVFLSMLEVSGFAAVEENHITKIVPSMQGRAAPTPVLSSEQSAEGDELVARVIQIKYVSAIQLVPILRPLVPAWSIINAYRPSNSIIMVGRAANIDRIIKIIQNVDTASHNGIDVIPLYYGIASDVVKTLNTLLQAQARNGQENVSVAADDRSNTILIGGNRAGRLRMKVLIKQLDSQSPSGAGGNTQVIYLEYMQATDLVPILAGVARSQFSGEVGTTIGTKTVENAPAIEGGVGGINSSTGNDTLRSQTSTISNVQGQASTQSTESGTKPRIEIIAEPNTNSIILNAPPNVMRVLKSVIARIDIRPAQVLVEALIAEVNENNIQDLGVEWGTLGNSASTTSGVFQTGFGVLSKGGFQSVIMQLNALAQDEHANILSTPQLVVLDNHLAHIKVGNEVSIRRSSQLSNVNGTPFDTFDRTDVALVLNVTPQISKYNSVKLNISHQNNSPRDINDSSGTQAFNISEISTSVIIRSGHVLVLGGLIQNQYLNNTAKPPVLGDFPGLGQFLHHHNLSRNRKKLMIFIRPTILRNDRQGMEITDSKYGPTRVAQLDMMRSAHYDESNKEYVLPLLKKPKKLPDPFQNHENLLTPYVK